MRLTMPYYNQLVLPAYAGMIPETSSPYFLLICAPRVCGDDPSESTRIAWHPPCSPRMRG